MNVRVKAAVAGDLRGLSVTEFCRQEGISRQTFYKWRARYNNEGLDGLEERSRRPHASPGRICAGMEERIVRLRKELGDKGADNGPLSIRWYLERDGVEDVPSETGIWRVLQRFELIEPQPEKRPKSSYRRFEWPRANDLWQMDATEVALADGTEVEVINIVDDHSRVCPYALAVPTATCENAWQAFCAGTADWGMPANVLTDNGLTFSGRRRGFEVAFEKNLRSVGVNHIASSFHHPQTCGKCERFQGTEKQWLDAQDPAKNLPELQSRLDTFRLWYNHDRPHTAAKGGTPAQRWAAAERAWPDGHTADQPQITGTYTVDARGIVAVRPWRIHLGAHHAGATVTVFLNGLDAAVFSGDTLIRALTIDPSHEYQRSTEPPT